MTKEVAVTTDHGTFTGKIIVSLRNRTETKDVHNPVLHEEVPKTIVWHEVKSILPDGSVFGVRETMDEDALLNLANEMDLGLRRYLMNDYHKTKQKSIEERLQDIGFK